MHYNISNKSLYNTLRQLSFLFLIVAPLLSCNNFTYSLHGAKKKYFARPGILFMDAIVNYRTFNHFWPASMLDFSLSSEANRKLAEQFKYEYTDFKVTDSNHLRIRFNSYKKDADNPETKDKIDLNSLRGEMRFFNVKDGFGWKLKMK
jgi:hypothetical protein